MAVVEEVAQQPLVPEEVARGLAVVERRSNAEDAGRGAGSPPAAALAVAPWRWLRRLRSNRWFLRRLRSLAVVEEVAQQPSRNLRQPLRITHLPKGIVD